MEITESRSISPSTCFAFPFLTLFLFKYEVASQQLEVSISKAFSHPPIWHILINIIISIYSILHIA